MLNIQNLIDDAKCFATVRTLRWPEGVCCVHCASSAVSKQGRDVTQPERQKYRCLDGGRWFDDLSGTIFSGHHQPLRTWVLCLYFMGLNPSNRQIAHELGLNKDNAQRMTRQLREGILSGEVEADEVYVVAGHKGHPEAVKKGRSGRRRRLKGARGRGTWAKEKPPILGLIQRGGEVVLRMLENVQQKTIEPVVRACVAEGTRFYTDEYDIYTRLPAWGDDHRSVCHSRANTPATRMAMASMRAMSIPLRASGRCYAPATPSPRNLPGEPPVVPELFSVRSQYPPPWQGPADGTADGAGGLTVWNVD